MIPEYLTAFADLCVAVQPVGSRVTCAPAPVGTDQDYLAFVPSIEAMNWLAGNDYVTTTDDNYEGMKSEFTSYKKGDVNIIITSDPEFYSAFMAATHIAKRLNLLKKQDRIALFQAVLYRNQWSEAAKCQAQ